MQRLDDMCAANCLADTVTLPGRYHPLRENRAGQWSTNLKHPLRLIFEPANDPLPKLSDNSLDLTKVDMIRILEVVDYHD
jgi:proteic killer suppression protein